ncbi:methylated-DNA--[protein]-cysteine S-methyltransferase [Chryseolinea lacunae]|uniref:Methylated-DNA--protein-cysteine methyltransferase n=1 Tax=Chryseolinea lacunae TaxID=2801331 RepID=A0ABS1KMR9_9BACT|nr:methylated-DNA--[protein]-cysteine S-methyltransferase [Chryseolinea lacunae]MBL0740547.1 methylated-DNA--[protein]-cysteine S-methyltransferase [Chryseolinea lacunae]
MEYAYTTINSPVGILKLIASTQALVAILWQHDDGERVSVHGDAERDDAHPILLETKKQLTEYFDKKRETFTLALDFEGTGFQKKVWQALLTIPYGTTTTYGHIAEQVGNAKAVRAVGGAVNKNPISIIAPCHRVVGSTGNPVGFGGGLHNKAILLRLEDRNPSLF